MARTRQNGEGSVYRRASDGMWIGSITIGWEADKRIRKTVSAKTGAAVRKSSRRTGQDTGLPLDDDKLTVNQLLDRWFNDVMRHQVASPRSRTTRPSPGFTSGRLLAGSKSQAKAGRDRRAVVGKARQRPRRLHRTAYRSVLAQALTQAQRWEMVGRNAASLSRPPRAPRRRAVARADQVGKLVNAMTEDRLASLFLTMLGRASPW